LQLKCASEDLKHQLVLPQIITHLQQVSSAWWFPNLSFRVPEKDRKHPKMTTHNLMLWEEAPANKQNLMFAVFFCELGDNMQLLRPRVFHSPRCPHDLEMQILQLPEDFAWLSAFCLGSPANSSAGAAIV